MKGAGGGRSTPGGCNNFWTFLLRREIPERMILGDNSAGHCFALRDLALIALFPVSHNYVTECMLQVKVLLKLV